MSHPRTSPPFRAEHVGSLLRPAELLSKRHAGAAEEELRAAEDAAIGKARICAGLSGIGRQGVEITRQLRGA